MTLVPVTSGNVIEFVTSTKEVLSSPMSVGLFVSWITKFKFGADPDAVGSKDF